MTKTRACQTVVSVLALMLLTAVPATADPVDQLIVDITGCQATVAEPTVSNRMVTGSGGYGGPCRYALGYELCVTYNGVVMGNSCVVNQSTTKPVPCLPGVWHTIIFINGAGGGSRTSGPAIFVTECLSPANNEPGP